jgi:protein-L-isoaspartate O-methyltransferase
MAIPLRNMKNMAKKKVLSIGIDPKLIDFNLATTTGWDANRVKVVAQDANKRLTELGYDVQNCFVDLGETAENVVSETLSREKFDCIMIGAGVRTLPQHTVMFEKIINTIHQKAPLSSKICFNTNPSDTVQAVLRWVSNKAKQ